MLATPATAEPSLHLAEAAPELGPPEDLLWPIWSRPRTWRPYRDWAQDRARRTCRWTSGARPDRRDDQPHRRPHIREHDLRGHPQDPIPEPPEHRVTAAISDDPPRVVAPVHLHDEPGGGGTEVRNEKFDGHLPPEYHAQRPAAELRPRRGLRRRECETHAARPGGNERNVLRMKGTGHDDLHPRPPLWGPPPARSLAGGEASTELGRVPPARSAASTGGVKPRTSPGGQQEARSAASTGGVHYRPPRGAARGAERSEHRRCALPAPAGGSKRRVGRPGRALTDGARTPGAVR